MKEEAAEVFKQGDFPQALDLHQQCLELDPMYGAYNAIMLLNISICQDKLGADKREVLRSLNQSIKYNPKYAKALVKRGDVHLALEEFDCAVRDYCDASEFDANGNNVQAKLKEAQAKAKKALKKDYYKILGVAKSA